MVAPPRDDRGAAPRGRHRASVVLLALLAAFLLELWQVTSDGRATGLTERLVAGAQALWPLVVTCALVRSARRAQVEAVRPTAMP